MLEKLVIIQFTTPHLSSGGVSILYDHVYQQNELSIPLSNVVEGDAERMLEMLKKSEEAGVPLRVTLVYEESPWIHTFQGPLAITLFKIVGGLSYI